MIRVLLVDDSAIALHILQRLLRHTNDIDIVGTASDGQEALNKISTLNPDVICTDLHMPVMNGLELTRAVMETQPRPILVVSMSVEPGSLNVFQLLEAGALDVYPKPCAILEENQEKWARELASKIRILAGVHVFKQKKKTTESLRPAPSPARSSATTTEAKIVVIGASTGGPQALRAILSALPASFPLPIVCIQHIGANFLDELLHWLAIACPLSICIPTDGEIPKRGIVYFAPGDMHLEFDSSGRFALSDAAPYEGHRPSINVTMKSTAHYFGAHTVGILLTGMGRDGADGLAEIAALGGCTVAQDEASSIVYGMPKAAVALGVVQQVLPLERIAPFITDLSNPRLNRSELPNPKETT